jgi:hypothetical protein
MLSKIEAYVFISKKANASNPSAYQHKTVTKYCKMVTYLFPEVHCQMTKVNPFVFLLFVADEADQTWFKIGFQ